MEDLFRMFRASKTHLQPSNKQQMINYKNDLNVDKSINRIGQSSITSIKIPIQSTTSSSSWMDSDRNGFNKWPFINSNQCTHVSFEKWEEIWRTNIKGRAPKLEGIVFVNPNFARLYFVPSIAFHCEFYEYNEYPEYNQQLLSHKGTDYHDKWMKTMIQPTSCFVSIHCCNVAEIIDRYCIRCPHLSRISFHYYHLDEEVFNFISQHLPRLVSINLENSIGLNGKFIAKLGTMSRLLHLNLSGCDINERTLHCILDNCTILESLNISNNCLITGHCLRHSTVKNLKRLNLQDCWRLTPERLIEMVQPCLPNLVEILCNSGINDQSLIAITSKCSNLNHLDISFEEFTYYDEAGLDCLSDAGFCSIARLIHLRILSLRHVGRISDNSINEIICSCKGLMQIVLNLRHRHKLTDARALRNLGTCTDLFYFEAVHNHFIAKNSIEHLSSLISSLQVLILRGDEFIKDDEAASLLKKCRNLRFINLDGCIDIGETTLASCIVHARKLLRMENENENSIKIFQASLVMTSVERSMLNSFVNEFPMNIRIRACDYRRNKVHFNEFDGQEIVECQLKEKFFPFYWHDFN
ncbi:uncharacterized protein LOC124492643 [Dermatophagoides farinae]|uniref:F-box and leucine-rich repeat protein 7-like protein n=1 Tax=Dermatophagoides farinae TaxID=6954 RepID=A0A9D4P113_DERFA|nr:uncharacterized protein LOC124492643 [Dermatophagoides farinae]KAH7642136.1 f-box and leucine-rich repeat protein 7-like protein [Dermatophagoides farinae]